MFHSKRMEPSATGLEVKITKGTINEMEKNAMALKAQCRSKTLTE